MKTLNGIFNAVQNTGGKARALMGGAALTAFSFLPFNSVSGQTAASVDNTPTMEMLISSADEIKANTKTITTDPKKEPLGLWRDGTFSDADKIAEQHDVISLYVLLGKELNVPKEDIANMIDNKIFVGDQEAKIHIVFEHANQGNGIAIMACMQERQKDGSLRSTIYTDDYTKEESFHWDEFEATVPQMVNKFQDKSRLVSTTRITLDQE